MKKLNETSKSKKNTQPLFDSVFFIVFAYRSDLLNGAQKSEKSWTLGTRQQAIHNKW